SRRRSNPIIKTTENKQLWYRNRPRYCSANKQAEPGGTRRIELIKAMLAKVIDGVTEPVPALPPPSVRQGARCRRSDRADSGLYTKVSPPARRILFTSAKRFCNNICHKQTSASFRLRRSSRAFG